MKESGPLRSPDSKLAMLCDRNGVIAAVLRYATGVDARDWRLYRGCFCDEIRMDFSSWSGQPEQTIPSNAWVEGVRAGLSGFDSTQHLSTNHRVTLSAEGDADSAHCVSYLQAQHHLSGGCGGGLYTLGGYYENTLVRSGAATQRPLAIALDRDWKIARSRLVVTWSQGDRGLFAEAAARLAERRGTM